MNRPLTQDERNMLINAVQTLVGRIDRNVGADGRRAAYHEVVQLLQREFGLRFQSENAPPSRGALPPPPPLRVIPARPVQEQRYDIAPPAPRHFDPFA